MNALLQNLLKLQALDFGEVTGKSVDSQVAALRGLIPPPILGHYDRLRVRGKKGVALVRNQVCTGCHMQQTVSKIAILMRDEDIQLCDSCGRYLYLEEEVPPAPVEPSSTPSADTAPTATPAKTKPAAKPRKRKLPKAQVAVA
jgi:hypothetical protein